MMSSNQPEIMSHLFAQKKIGLSLFCGLLLAMFSVLSFAPFTSSAAYALDYSSLTEWKSVNAYAPVASVVFSPDQSMLAAGLDGKVQVYSDKLELIKELKASDNKKASSEVQPLGGSTTDQRWMMALAFSPDSKLIAAACYDGTVRIWDIKTGAETICKDPKLAYDEWTARSHKGAVRSIAFSPDGLKIVSGGDDKAVKMWDVKSGNLLWKGEEHVYRVVAVVFSTDGKSISSFGAKDIATKWSWEQKETGEFKTWDATTGQLKQSVTANYCSPYGAAISPDGTITASAGNGIYAWDFKSGRCMYSIQSFQEPPDPFGKMKSVPALCFSPDGSLIVTCISMLGWNGRDDYQISVLNAQNGQSMMMGNTIPWGDHIVVPEHISAVAVSKDNRSLIFGCKDGTIQIWRLP